MRAIFPKLFGNERNKSRLGGAILRGRLPHALLIDGGIGSGKLTLAKSIAAALNCEHRTDEGYPLPCHLCSTCRRIFDGSYTDMRVLEAEDGRATIGVEQIKDIRRDMFLTATEAAKKIYVIREAEKLTPAAQNALLIVLEEPPRDVVIMLLASGTDKILTTIKSRAQYIALSRFPSDEIKRHLLASDAEAERIYRADPEGFDAALASADGRIGMAKQLISPEHRAAIAEERAETAAILSALRHGRGYKELYEAVSDLPTKRAELSLSLERIILAVGDLIRLRHARDAAPIFYKSPAEAEESAEGISTKRLFKVYDIVSRAYDANLKNANTTALLATLASELKGS